MIIKPYLAPSVRKTPVNGARYVITMTGRDREGILKSVTRFMAEKNVNIENWCVEFIDGNVMHIGEVTIPGMLDIKQVQDEFRQLVSEFWLECSIQHENIFKATNEVGAIRTLLDG